MNLIDGFHTTSSALSTLQFNMALSLNLNSDHKPFITSLSPNFLVTRNPFSKPPNPIPKIVFQIPDSQPQQFQTSFITLSIQNLTTIFQPSTPLPPMQWQMAQHHLQNNIQYYFGEHVIAHCTSPYPTTSTERWISPTYIIKKKWKSNIDVYHAIRQAIHNIPPHPNAHWHMTPPITTLQFPNITLPPHTTNPIAIHE